MLHVHETSITASLFGPEELERASVETAESASALVERTVRRLRARAVPTGPRGLDWGPLRRAGLVLVPPRGAAVRRLCGRFQTAERPDGQFQAAMHQLQAAMAGLADPIATPRLRPPRTDERAGGLLEPPSERP